MIPGSQELQNLTAAAIVDILFNADIGWLALIASGLGYLAYDLLGLCNTDPPAWPTIDGPRLFSYTNPLDPQGAQFLREDVTAIVGRILWFQYCQCVTGPQPTNTTPPAQPSGQQTNNPVGNNTPGGQTPCNTGGTIFETLSADANGDYVWGFTGLPTLPLVGAQWVQFLWNSNLFSGTSPYPVTHTLQFLGTGGTILFQDVWTQTAGTIFAQQVGRNYTLPPNVTGFSWVTHTSVASPGSVGMDMTMSWYCTAPPESLQQPCCPPDPTLENMVIQILQNEQFIIQLLESLGNSNPSSYTKGNVHSGLSNTGSLTVSGLAGILVDITAQPDTKQQPGNPPYIWDMGWLSMLTTDGMIDEKRLTRQQQLWIPRTMAMASTIGYFLFPGVTATITELLPA